MNVIRAQYDFFLYLLVRPVRVEEEPRLESRPRWPVGEVTVEEVVVLVEEEVVEELKSSCLLPKELLKKKRKEKNTYYQGDAK